MTTFTNEIQNILNNKDMTSSEKRNAIFLCFSDTMHYVIERETNRYNADQYWGMVNLRALMMDEFEKRE